MGPTDRRAREKAETEARILLAARTLFAQQGYEAVTLRAIADAIEYTPAAIYKHFADKDELVRRLCECDFALMAEGLPQVKALPNPVVRIAVLGREYVRFATAHPEHFRVMFLAPSPKWWGEGKDAPPQETGHDVLLAATRQALAEKRTLPHVASAELTAMTLWAAVHGVAALEVSFHGRGRVPWPPVEDRTRDMIGAMLRAHFRPADAAAALEALR